ncbi:uncharacterized protein M6B38_277635 [Iris pallida]|uniref:Uncharacterized protein n=1 Tax=Iris pallida TaxID=29817 RepID=A0AAX6I2T5_IRIPA|nr:uncharacterized protein M6B38_277635 [Iris pallida]
MSVVSKPVRPCQSVLFHHYKSDYRVRIDRPIRTSRPSQPNPNHSPCLPPCHPREASSLASSATPPQASALSGGPADPSRCFLWHPRSGCRTSSTAETDASRTRCRRRSRFQTAAARSERSNTVRPSAPETPASRGASLRALFLQPSFPPPIFRRSRRPCHSGQRHPHQTKPPPPPSHKEGRAETYLTRWPTTTRPTTSRRPEPPHLSRSGASLR